MSSTQVGPNDSSLSSAVSISSVQHSTPSTMSAEAASSSSSSSSSTAHGCLQCNARIVGRNKWCRTCYSKVNCDMCHTRQFGAFRRSLTRCDVCIDSPPVQTAARPPLPQPAVATLGPALTPVQAVIVDQVARRQETSTAPRPLSRLSPRVDEAKIKREQEVEAAAREMELSRNPLYTDLQGVEPAFVKSKGIVLASALRAHGHPNCHVYRQVLEDEIYRDLRRRVGSAGTIVDVGGSLKRHAQYRRKVHSMQPVVFDFDLATNNRERSLVSDDLTMCKCVYVDKPCACCRPDAFMMINSLYYLKAHQVASMLRYGPVVALTHIFTEPFGKYKNEFEFVANVDSSRGFVGQWDEVQMVVHGNKSLYSHSNMMWLTKPVKVGAEWLVPHLKCVNPDMFLYVVEFNMADSEPRTMQGVQLTVNLRDVPSPIMSVIKKSDNAVVEATFDVWGEFFVGQQGPMNRAAFMAVRSALAGRARDSLALKDALRTSAATHKNLEGFPDDWHSRSITLAACCGFACDLDLETKALEAALIPTRNARAYHAQVLSDVVGWKDAIIQRVYSVLFPGDALLSSYLRAGFGTIALLCVWFIWRRRRRLSSMDTIRGWWSRTQSGIQAAQRQADDLNGKRISRIQANDAAIIQGSLEHSRSEDGSFDEAKHRAIVGWARHLNLLWGVVVEEVFKRLPYVPKWVTSTALALFEGSPLGARIVVHNVLAYMPFAWSLLCHYVWNTMVMELELRVPWPVRLLFMATIFFGFQQRRVEHRRQDLVTTRPTMVVDDPAFKPSPFLEKPPRLCHHWSLAWRNHTPVVVRPDGHSELAAARRMYGNPLERNEGEQHAFHHALLDMQNITIREPRFDGDGLGVGMPYCPRDFVFGSHEEAYRAWNSASRFGTHMVLKHDEAFEESFVLFRPTYHRRTMFVKVEKKNMSVDEWFYHYVLGIDSAGDPRHIQTVGQPVHVTLGPPHFAWSKCLALIWSVDNCITYASGMTGFQVARAFDDDYASNFCGDVSRFDRSVDEMHLDALNKFKEQYCFSERELGCLAEQLFTKGVTMQGRHVYSVHGQRKSGDANTSCDNSVLNALMHLWAIRQTTGESYVDILRQIKIVVLGDDIVIRGPRWLERVNFKAQLARIGFTSKPKFTRERWEIDFCSKRLWPSTRGYSLGAKPGRALARFGYSHEPVMKQSLAGVVASLWADNRHVPFLRIFLQRARQLYGDAEPDGRLPHEDCGDVVDETWSMLHHLYGLTRDDERDFEAYIATWNGGPALGDHPHVDTLCRVDL